MVPQITHPHSLKRTLNYNEQKMQKGQAALILAGNFLQNPEELNFSEKLNRFEKLMELNDRAKTKTIHISLNFHPDDTSKLTREFLQQVSAEYMQKLGFGNQPYLVYQHHDAGHPHVHIVSTLIRDDGSRINTHKLGKDMSEPIRKEMEKKYGLVKADKKEFDKEQSLQVINAKRVVYGKSETKRSITNVLDNVIDQYKYTSLHELNAVLKQFNVMADRGNPAGRIYKTHGLTYHVLDENGKKIGVPIKASAIYSKPTLQQLEKRFVENEKRREPEMKHLKNIIDWALQKNIRSLEDFVKALGKDRVAVVIRRGDQGRVYGITYVDYERKAVFNGSDLGKEYAAKRLLERLGIEQQPLKVNGKENVQQKWEPDKIPSTSTPNQQNFLPMSDNRPNQYSVIETIGKGVSNLIQELSQPDDRNETLNSELKKENEKRRRRRNQEREQ